MRSLVLLVFFLAACGGAGPDVARGSAAALEAPCDDPAAFGVVAGARGADGTWNPQPTDVRGPLQAWLDSCAGSTATLPRGAYYVRAKGGGAALAVTAPMRVRAEPDAVIYVDGDAQTDALLLELTPDVHAWSAIRPVDVAVTIRGWHFASASYRHGVVMHVNSAYLHDSQVNEAAGWGVLVESGNAGVNLEGASRLPQGTYVNSNFTRIDRVLVADDGDQSYPGELEGGGGLRVHGSDANGIEVADCTCTYASICFADGSLEGVTWRRDYVEVGGGAGQAVGYADWSSAGARYYDCREEIAHPSVPGPRSRSFGSTTLFRGTPAATVDGLLASIALPLRNTQDRWQWRQRGVTLPPGVTVVRSAANWSNSSGVMRPDTRVANAEVRLEVVPELPAVDAWDQRLTPQQADAQTAARAAALLALDVSCGAVGVGYQDEAGGLVLARCENHGQAPVVVDLLWAGEVYARTSAGTGGP